VGSSGLQESVVPWGTGGVSMALLQGAGWEEIGQAGRQRL